MGESARQDLNGTGVRVTLVEPGMVDTPFFDNPPEIEALKPDDIARAVMFAVQQPPHVDVNEILIRPTAQPARPARTTTFTSSGRRSSASCQRSSGTRRVISVAQPAAVGLRRARRRPPRSGGGWR